MIKLAIGFAVVFSFLMWEMQPESVPSSDHKTGPFADSGQAILAGIIVVMNIITGWYTNYMTDRRDTRKEQLAMKQREMDEERLDRQRKWDLEDRREAREALEQKFIIRAAKADVQDGKLDSIITLTDGSNTRLLQEIADLKRSIAEGSERKADIRGADSAQDISDAQIDRVNSIKDKDKDING